MLRDNLQDCNSDASEATVQAVHSSRVENSQRQLHDQHPWGSVAVPSPVISTPYVAKQEEALPLMTKQTQSGRPAVAAVIAVPQNATTTEHAATPASNNHQRQLEQEVYKPPDVTRFGYDSMFGWKYFKSFIGLDTGQSLIK